MAIDLQPLTSEIIHKMGYSTHDLWVVKINNEMFGPFEVESLKQYAAENSPNFQHAMASRMDTNDWMPFHSHAQFQGQLSNSTPEQEVVEKYWIVYQGQKAGPLSRLDIDKKLELSIISLNELVSLDDGQTWARFYSLPAFCPHYDGATSLPKIPFDSSFLRAKEALEESIGTDEKNIYLSSLATLTYQAQHKNQNTIRLNLNEMDLKTLNQTEVSRSLKWAVPSAVAGVTLLALVGNFLLSPSSSPDEVAFIEESKVEKSLASVPESKPARRAPASYHPPVQPQPVQAQRPVIQPEYPSQIETHYNEQDPMMDPRNEEVNYMPPAPQEHSLLSNNIPENETLDDMMSGNGDERFPPEQPVIEESNDF